MADLASSADTPYQFGFFEVRLFLFLMLPQYWCYTIICALRILDDALPREKCLSAGLCSLLSVLLHSRNSTLTI